MRRVLGIDPSLTGTGIAWADDGTATCTGVGDQRLWVIYRSVHRLASGIDELAGYGGPFEFAVVEDLPTHGQGAGKTGMAQGVVRLALLHACVPYRLVAPATLKTYATGKGNATKPDLRMALYQRTGIDLRDDNQVDAWWLRALGLDLLGEPVVELPQTHRRALAKVERPDHPIERTHA